MKLLLLSLLSLSIVISNAEQSRFQCELTKNSNHTQGIYSIYDAEKGILHVLSFAGEPTFLIYNTTAGSESLKFEWNNATGSIEKVSLSSYGLLYGFVLRNLIEFKVAGANVNFDIEQFDKSNDSSTLFRTYPLSDLKYNLTALSDCNITGKIRVSLQQKNNTNLTQLNFLFDVQAHASEGRLSDQPRYLYLGNNSVMDFVITGFPFNLTAKDTPSSRLALEFDFIKFNGTSLIHSSEQNIDDEYTPAVFLQDTIQARNQPIYFYWKPISYADASRKVEDSMMVTYLNGRVTPPISLNTTGFFPSLQQNVSALQLERSLLLFGTDGGSNLNPAYLFFRAELGIGQHPTDSISLPLIIAIGVGFGLPVLGLALGSVGLFVFMLYKCCFRTRTKNSRYVMIN